MAYTDHIYKYDFMDIDNNSLTLYLYPGHNADYSSPTTYAMPGGTLKDADISLERGFENDLPLGIELAHKLSFELDLTFLSGTFASGAEDWNDVKESILSGISPNTKAVNNQTLYLPNVWKLYNNTTSKTVFEGVQNYTPTEKINRNALNILEYKITCIDVISYAITRVKPADIDDVATTHSVNRQYNLLYTADGYTIQNFKQADSGMNYASLQAFYLSIEDKIQEVIRALVRDATKTYAINTDSFVRAADLHSNKTIDGLDRTDGIIIGMSITGTGIAANTVVLSIDSTTAITVNNNTTSTSTEDLTFSATIITPYDLHGYYRPGTTTAAAKSTQLLVSDMYIAKRLASPNNAIISLTGYEESKPVKIGDKYYTTVTTADTSDLSVGDLVQPYYYPNYQTISDIPNSTHFVMWEYTGLAGGKLNTNYQYVIEKKGTIYTSGFLVDAAPPSIYSHTTIYDYLSKEIFSKLGKATYNYNSTDNDYQLNIKHFYDSWDTIGNTLTNSDIYRDTVDIARQHGYYNEVVCKIISQASDCINEYSNTNEGNDNSNSITLEPILQNDMVCYDNQEHYQSKSSVQAYWNEKLYANLLHYEQAATTLLRIWHGITVNLGNGISYDSEDLTPTAFNLPNGQIATLYLNGLKYFISGMYKEFAGNALSYVLSQQVKQQNAPLIPFITHDKYDYDDVGNYLIGVDPDSLMGTTTQLTSTRGFLTSIKYDIKNNEYENNIWIK